MSQHPEGLRPCPAERVGTQPPPATAHGAALPPPRDPGGGLNPPKKTCENHPPWNRQARRVRQGHGAARAAPGHRQGACTRAVEILHTVSVHLPDRAQTASSQPRTRRPRAAYILQLPPGPAARPIRSVSPSTATTAPRPGACSGGACAPTLHPWLPTQAGRAGSASSTKELTHFLSRGATLSLKTGTKASGPLLPLAQAVPTCSHLPIRAEPQHCTRFPSRNKQEPTHGRARPLSQGHTDSRGRTAAGGLQKPFPSYKGLEGFCRLF